MGAGSRDITDVEFEGVERPLEVVARIPYDPAHQTVLGSLGWDGIQLGRGNIEGGVDLSATTPTRRVAWHRGWFADHVHGVQWSGADLVCLGSSARTSAQGDWGVEVQWRESNGGEFRLGSRLGLGQGLWRQVKGVGGRCAYVYDALGSGGVVGIDAYAGRIAWHALEGERVRRLCRGREGFLVGLTESMGGELVEIDLDDGKVGVRKALPKSETIEWTAAVCAGESEWILAGYARHSRDYRVAAFSLAGRALEMLHASRVEDHFPLAVVAYVASCEEDCGNDLHEVADLVWIQPRRRLLVVLGGNGEALGACQGATAVGVLDLAAPESLVSQLLDDGSGCSGTCRDGDGRILVEAGDVYFLRGSVV